LSSPADQALQRPREAVNFTRSRLNPLFGIKAVGSFVPRLTRKAFERYGFSTATLAVDWPAIVGPELAAHTALERLKWPKGRERVKEGASTPQNGGQGATLVLRVDGARALDVQYKAGQIIERINGHFGYAAIAQLRIVQAPVEPVHCVARPTARPASVPLMHEVAHVADPGLRSALARLGASVKASR
jgi:hypothetical protein